MHLEAGRRGPHPATEQREERALFSEGAALVRPQIILYDARH